MEWVVAAIAWAACIAAGLWLKHPKITPVVYIGGGFIIGAIVSIVAIIFKESGWEGLVAIAFAIWFANALCDHYLKKLGLARPRKPIRRR